MYTIKTYIVNRTMKDKRTARVYVRLTEEERAILNAYAAKKGYSTSEVVRDYIKSLVSEVNLK